MKLIEVLKTPVIKDDVHVPVPLGSESGCAHKSCAGMKQCRYMGKALIQKFNRNHGADGRFTGGKGETAAAHANAAGKNYGTAPSALTTTHHSDKAWAARSGPRTPTLRMNY